MSNKKRVLVFVSVLILVTIACTATEIQAVTENQQEAVSDSYPEEIFQLLGIIGMDAEYSVYRMTDGDEVCYIILDEFVANFADTNSAPAIHCP